MAPSYPGGRGGGQHRAAKRRVGAAGVPARHLRQPVDWDAKLQEWLSGPEARHMTDETARAISVPIERCLT